MYLKKRDNKRFSKKNRYPVVKVYETHKAGDEYPGYVVINAALRFKPEWVVEIDEKEYDRIRAEVDAARPSNYSEIKEDNKEIISTPDHKTEPFHKKGNRDRYTVPLVHKPLPKAVANPFPFHPGEYIRKKNWTFFNGTDMPAMRVNSIRKAPEAGTFYINKFLLYEAHLVKLTVEEAHAINTEFNDMHLAKVLLKNTQETTCVRESTGANKKVWTEKEAIRYVFTYNKTNPGKEMNAYTCPHCHEIHCGKVPTKQAQKNDQRRGKEMDRINKNKSIPFKEIVWPNTWLWIGFFIALAIAVAVITFHN